MGQIITTQNLVAIKEVRHAGQKHTRLPETEIFNFVSKYPSSVAAILKLGFPDHVTAIFQPTPISDPGPQSSWAST